MRKIIIALIASTGVLSGCSDQKHHILAFSAPAHNIPATHGSTHGIQQTQ